MRRLATTLLAAIGIAACSDSPTAATAPEVNPSVAGMEVASTGLGRYVALGTSISMGWASDGVVASSQRDSWPAQLAALDGRTLDQPYISGAGCRAPMAAPLASGATTFEALYVTPETRNDPFCSRLYSLILPRQTTQLRAALRYPSDFASVEFGANEVLGARDGRAIPGVNLYPYAPWSYLYSALVDTVRMRVPRGVLVGLIWDVASFPAFREGRELWANRMEFFQSFNIEVKRTCKESSNLVVVPFVVPAKVAAGLAARRQGLPAVELSCEAGPDAAADYVLRPSEPAVVNAQLRQMNDFIEALARRIGYAYFELDVLHSLPAVKPPFSVLTLMTSQTPYSAYMSLDGFHPNAIGQRVLALAAARAINRRNGLALPTSGILVD